MALGSQGDEPVDARALTRTVAIELFDKSLRNRGERLFVARRPPIHRRALSVETTPAVVEAVADLMAHNRADRPIVRRIVGVRIEERRLQHGGRSSHDFVEHGVAWYTLTVCGVISRSPCAFG